MTTRWEPLPNPEGEPTRTLWSAVRVLPAADHALRVASAWERNRGDDLLAEILETESAVAEWGFILGRWAITAAERGTPDDYKIVSMAEFYKAVYTAAAAEAWKLWRIFG